ncbi:MAG: peptidylprolyl isomerase [Rhodothermales bacterium]
MSFRVIDTLFATTLAVLVAIVPQCVTAQQGEVLDEIVAVVGDKIILKSEVDATVANLLQQQPQIGNSDRVWSDALNQIISQQLLAVAARRDTNITVQEEQVDQSLDQRINQMVSQLGSEARLEELYGRSIVRIKADLRDDFRDQLLADQLRQSKIQNIRITPTEVKEWIEQFPADSLPTIPTVVRVNHIVRFPEVTAAVKAEAREIISTIRDSIIVGGASFEEMARQFSDDQASVPSGGRMEDMNLGDLVPEFAAVAARLPIGEVSQVFETQFGFHIMRVNERRGETVDFNHILVQVDDSRVDPAPTIEFLSQVRDSIVTHGAPFELMAKRHSQDEASARLGGRVLDPRSGERDLILSNLGELWRATLDTMEVGEVSKPGRVQLQSENRQAYHIVKLIRRQEEHRMSLETDYERIEEFALQEKRARWMQNWIDGLRDEIYVDLRGKAERLEIASR